MGSIPFPVAWTTDKLQQGVNSLRDKRPRFQILDLREMLERQFLADVHFVGYALATDGLHVDQEPWPRINKPCLNEIREARAEVFLTCMTFDFDLADQPEMIGEDFKVDAENKPIWTPELSAKFWASVPTIYEELLAANLAPANWIYTTHHGARFIHQLKKPIPVGEDCENRIRGMIAAYKSIGINMDPRCADWTRVFRAPRVLRGGSRTWTMPWFALRQFDTYLLDASDIVPVSRAIHNDVYADLRPIDRGQPSPEDCYARLHLFENGKEKPTQTHREAQKILKGTDCYPVCFEDRPIAEEGARDATLIRLVGQAVAYLMAHEGQSFAPEDVYALFLPAVEQLKPDAGTRDWTASLWSKVRTCWAREEAKLRAQVHLRDEQRTQAADRERRLMEFLCERCDLPALHSSDDQVRYAALDALKILVTPDQRVRLLTPNGYTKTSVPINLLPMFIRQCKVADIIETTTETAKGVSVPAPTEWILRRYGTMVNRIIGQVAVEKSHLIGDSWDGLTLVEALYARKAISGQFSERVEAWLRELVGDDHLPELNRWIAYALAFEEGPIAALSLAGPPSVGKGMFVRGLLECLETEAFATCRDLTAEKNPSLRTSPFLIVDEGLPRRLPGGKDAADVFRSLSAGEPTIIDEKYKALVTVRNPMRIVFTANNTEVIMQLAGRTLSQDDITALSLRIQHFTVREQAAQHLRLRGGMDYTAGWVQPTAGGDSEYILARHFLWLYENRHTFRRDQRLLVEGGNSDIVQAMRTEDDFASDMATLLVRMVEGWQTLPPLVGAGVSIDEETGQFWVSAHAVKQLHDADLASKEISLTKVGRVLQTVTSRKLQSARRGLDGQVRKIKWWAPDLNLLQVFAANNGLPFETIQRLNQKQHELARAIELVDPLK